MLIRPEEIKTLIKNLALIKAARDSLKTSAESWAENVDDNIYSACMNSSGEGIPAIGSISDKTAKIALSNKASGLNGTRQIQKDITTLENVIENLNNAVKCLNKAQKKILDLRYPDEGETPWKDVVRECNKSGMNFSEGHIRRIHGYSIERMITASQITVDTYNEAMEIMNGRGM